MSRGLGRIEREVLGLLEPGELLGSATVAGRVFGTVGSYIPTRAEHASVCQALASLARKGLVQTNATRHWGTLKAVQKANGKRLRLQSSHSREDRGLDPYFTCPEAIESLIRLESHRMPRCIWEPCAGGGGIVLPLRNTGRVVVASDIKDYGLLPDVAVRDYLTATVPPGVEGIVTNPPYRLALAFLAKALAEVPYVALLVRTNFLMEGKGRAKLLKEHPPTKEWRSEARFPMMHRLGWAGKKASSNTAYAWAVWQRGALRELPESFDWQELLGAA